MAASAIIQRPNLLGNPPLGANRAGHLNSPTGKAFATTLESLLNSSDTESASAKSFSGANPLGALNQLLRRNSDVSKLNLGGEQRLNELRSRTEQLQQRFQSSIRELLEAQGIDLGAGVQLQLDADGEIRVANDHPDKLFIESAIKNDPALANQFRKIAADAALLRAAELARDFQQAYGQDPQRALREFEELFGKQAPPTFSLTITDAGIETSFSQLQATASQPIL